MSQRRREIIAAVVAVGFGIAIAYMDSRPGFDATGITAGSLLVTGLVAAFIGGRRPWLWALATGIWMPVFEIRDASMWAPLAALVFTGIGALIGWLAARA
ncbi:MAG: hypothetical protein EPO00_11110 [Chloroflexota bacterium]|nr:MAG: hypothetical protein EPO00_11110 [Chloroflexota bacterium]